MPIAKARLFYATVSILLPTPMATMQPFGANRPTSYPPMQSRADEF